MVIMNEPQNRVRTWMRAIGQATPSKPCIPDKDTCDLRVDLIDEELYELCEALSRKDMVETYDALNDLLYVVIGAAVACGMELQPGWLEVCRSNDTKVVDGFKDAAGKWRKGPSYEAPKLGPILKELEAHP